MRKIKRICTELHKNRILYAMALPGMIALLIFNYLPLMGLVIAFKDFNVIDGIWGSPWNGLENFKFYFTTDKAAVTTFNTLILNALFIIFGLIFQIGCAILLNEIKQRQIKRVTQSIIFLPYFLSWVVVGAIIYSLLSANGTVNHLLTAIGLEKISFFMEAKYWKAILIIANIWKATGYGSIIYLSTLTGIDHTLYEAAMVDGANKWKQIFYITLPMLMPTAIVLTLLSIGRIFYGDFGMVYGIVRDNGMLFNATDVIDTYVFRAMRLTGEFGMATAVGLYQSIVGFILVLASNLIVKRHNREASLF